MQTNRGRTVEIVAGNAAEIAERGSSVTTLGKSMVAAAGVLKSIENKSLEGEGFATDKIREVVGGAHVDLDEAGRRYTPAGTTLTKYAAALEKVQTQMAAIISDCVESEHTLSLAMTAAADAASDKADHEQSLMYNPPAPDQVASHAAEGRQLSAAVTAAAAARESARTSHSANLDRFDVQYDVWDEAYEAAVSGLTNANDIGKDSRWENIAGVLAVIAEVLSWVGVAIAVIGLFVGGPFIAIAAVVIGVLALAFTIALMFDGRKGWGDLAWAIVGILPIGKLGMLFKKGQRLGFLKEIPKGVAKPFQQVKAMKNLQFAPRSGWRANWLPKFNTYTDGIRNVKFTGPFTLKGLAERFVGGANRSFAVRFTETISSAPTQAMKFQVQVALPEALAKLAGASPTKFEQLFNVYKWVDRSVSLSNGRPSGALSPAGFLNGLAR